MNFLTNLDMNQNQIMNVVLQKLAVAPSSPASGQMYFNTVEERAFIHNGKDWVGMDSVDATMTGEDIVTTINLSSSLINDKNLSQAVRDAISKSHSSHTISDVTGLQAALDSKETPSGASAKASTAEDNAKGYTDSKIADLIGSAPETLDTLHEIAEALGEDPNFATTILGRLAKKTKKHVASVGDGAKTSFVLTHNLNTKDVNVMIRQTASPYAMVMTDVEMTTVNTVTVKFAEAPTSSEYTVTIIG